MHQLVVIAPLAHLHQPAERTSSQRDQTFRSANVTTHKNSGRHLRVLQFSQIRLARHTRKLDGFSGARAFAGTSSRVFSPSSMSPFDSPVDLDGDEEFPTSKESLTNSPLGTSPADRNSLAARDLGYSGQSFLSTSAPYNIAASSSSGPRYAIQQQNPKPAYGKHTETHAAPIDFKHSGHPRHGLQVSQGAHPASTINNDLKYTNFAAGQPGGFQSMSLPVYTTPAPDWFGSSSSMKSAVNSNATSSLAGSSYPNTGAFGFDDTDFDMLIKYENDDPELSLKQ